VLPSFPTAPLPAIHVLNTQNGSQQGKVAFLRTTGDVYQRYAQITIIVIERSRFAGSICSGSVRERIDVRSLENGFDFLDRVGVGASIVTMTLLIAA
jgi:hypothetical protein